MDYVINKNAKNAWIRDNDDTMDLSPETDAGTVYLNNGRTLEQELGEGSMVSNVVTVNSAMSKVIDGTYDGAYESCIFKGQTKWIDNDTGEILDSFVANRNLSLIDVKMPVLKNVGKNLYKDEGGKTNSTIDGFTGVESTGGTRFVPNFYTPVKSNMTYTLYRKIARLNCGIRYYDKNKKYIPQSLVPPFNGFNSLTFTTPSNCHYVRFIDEANIINNEYVIYLGEEDKGVEYQPHKSNTLTTPEEIILRSLPNGVQDTYNPLTGEYAKRVGEIVLDGSEAWIANTGGDKRFEDVWVFHNQDSLCDGDIRLCNKLQARESGNENAEFVRGGGTYVFIYISKNKVQNHNALDFKAWLSQNPLTIQYELETPIIKKVESKGHPFAYENGHVILESSYQGQSLLPIMDYSTVVNRTGQIKSIGEQSLRQDKQINKLEQMLVGNIIAMNYSNTLLKLNLTMNEVK